MAVGKGHACTPITERTGIAAVNEHFPKDDRSCITATFFIITSKKHIYLNLNSYYHKSRMWKISGRALPDIYEIDQVSVNMIALQCFPSFFSIFVLSAF